MAQPAPATSAGPAGEPVFVYGTDLAGRCDQGTAAVAARYHGAVPGTASGPTGNAYAIPFRNSGGALLAVPVIRNYVDSFLHFAASNAGRRFHVGAFGCDRGEHEAPAMATLFAGAPANCQLPGAWQRHLDSGRPVRLLLFDPGANLAQPLWQSRLEQYLALNAPLWGGSAVELVSVGNPRAIVAAEMAARRLELGHRVIGASDKVYGQNAPIVAEYRAVWYATHFLAVSDLDQTSDPQQIRLMTAATRAGLLVDMLNSRDD